MKNTIRPKGGFTLVEIMIVVAIIGMLATIAVPNYVKVREKSQTTTCIANLRLIDGAIQSWSLDARKDSSDAVSYSDIKGFLKSTPVCPSGGTSFEDSYSITRVDARPECLRKPQSHTMPGTPDTHAGL
jgi:prepilin-type N-terminal cleavage/methylation domain-containing protein